MNSKTEKVTYCRLEKSLRLSLKNDFPNMSNRFDRLEERIACYFEHGEVIGFAKNPSACPKIAVVTFVRGRANTYEKHCNDFFNRRHTKVFEVPQPQFTVQLLIESPRGDMEQYEFDFRRYYDKPYLTEFCKTLYERMT